MRGCISPVSAGSTPVVFSRKPDGRFCHSVLLSGFGSGWLSCHVPSCDNPRFDSGGFRLEARPAHGRLSPLALTGASKSTLSFIGIRRGRKNRLPAGTPPFKRGGVVSPPFKSGTFRLSSSIG